MYIANSFMSAWPLKPNRPLVVPAQPSFRDGLVRVRSKHPSTGTNGAAAFGLVASFGKKPAPAHCDGSTSVVSPTGALLLSRQGEFTVGSVNPTLQCSFRRVCAILPPILRLWLPFTYERSARR